MQIFLSISPSTWMYIICIYTNQARGSVPALAYCSRRQCGRLERGSCWHRRIVRRSQSCLTSQKKPGKISRPQRMWEANIIQRPQIGETRNQWLGYSDFWTQLSDGMWLGLVRARMCFCWAELCVVLKLEVTLPKSTQYSEIVEIIVNQPLLCKGYCARVHCRPIFECFGPVSMKRGLQPCTAKDRFASAPDATPKILMVSQAGRITQVLQDFSIPSL